MNLGIWTVSAGQSNLKLNVTESETDLDIYKVEEEYSVCCQAPTGSIFSCLDSDKSMPVSWTDRMFYCQRSHKTYLVNLFFLCNQLLSVSKEKQGFLLLWLLLPRLTMHFTGVLNPVLCLNSSLSDFDGVQWQDCLSHRTVEWCCCLFFNHSYTSASEREKSQSNKQKIKLNQQKPTK